MGRARVERRFLPPSSGQRKGHQTLTSGPNLPSRLDPGCSLPPFPRPERLLETIDQNQVNRARVLARPLANCGWKGGSSPPLCWTSRSRTREAGSGERGTSPAPPKGALAAADVASAKTSGAFTRVPSWGRPGTAGLSRAGWGGPSFHLRRFLWAKAQRAETQTRLLRGGGLTAARLTPAERGSLPPAVPQLSDPTFTVTKGRARVTDSPRADILWGKRVFLPLPFPSSFSSGPCGYSFLSLRHCSIVLAGILST